MKIPITCLHVEQNKFAIILPESRWASTLMPVSHKVELMVHKSVLLTRKMNSGARP